jgi:hypothetical protein
MRWTRRARRATAKKKRSRRARGHARGSHSGPDELIAAVRAVLDGKT